MQSLTPLEDPADYGLEIKKSPIHGYGVFATKDFAINEVICPFTYDEDQVFTINEYRAKYGKSNLYTYRDMRHNKMVYVGEKRNIISYTNENADDPNVKLLRWKLISLKEIKKGEELFLKYWYKNEYNKTLLPVCPYCQQIIKKKNN